MISLLRTTPLLCALDDAQLARVAARAHRHTLDEGVWLFAQGDPARHFHLVVSGQIRLFRLSREGGEKVIEIVSPGETFAEALMFLKAPRYPVCAAALAPAEVISLDGRDFREMLRESSDTCFVILGSLSRRLRVLISDIDNLTLHSARSRLARWLLSHCPEDRRAFALDVRKGVLASRLSIKPETFSRVVKQLVDEGVISMHGAHVTLHDRHALIEAADLADSAELGTVGCSALPSHTGGGPSA